LSGADIESIVLSTKRRALTAGRTEVQKADLEESLRDFIPSAQGLEKELQELAAVLECTQLNFLPPDLREKSHSRWSHANPRTLVALRQLLNEHRTAHGRGEGMAKKKGKGEKSRTRLRKAETKNQQCARKWPLKSHDEEDGR